MFNDLKRNLRSTFILLLCENVKKINKGKLFKKSAGLLRHFSLTLELVSLRIKTIQIKCFDLRSIYKGKF